MTIPEFNQCLFEAYDIPWQAFVMERNGQKKNYCAQERQKLYLHLAKFANADGTNSRPSIGTLMERTGWSRAKVFRLLGELKAMKLIECTGRFGERGVAVYRLLKPATVSDSEPQSQFQGDHPSQIQRLKSQIQELQSQISMLGSHPDDTRPVDQLNQLTSQRADKTLSERNEGVVRAELREATDALESMELAEVHGKATEQDVKIAQSRVTALISELIERAQV